MTNKLLLIDKIYLFLLLVVVLNFFDFLPLKGQLRTHYFLFLSLFYMLARCQGCLSSIVKRSCFGKELIWLAIGYSITIFFSIAYWEQSLKTGVVVNFYMVLMVFLYFYYIRINISEEKIIKAFVICTVIWNLLEWGQQLTYPTYWFAGREEDDFGMMAQRMGLWRFYITGVHLAIFVLVYYAGKFAKVSDRRKHSFLMWAIAMIGIIGFVSRKQIYASLLVSLIAFVMLKGKYRIFVILLLLASAFYGIQILMESMSDLNLQTQEELGSDDFIRFVATHYFLFEFSDSPIYYLFGTGAEGGDSKLNDTYVYLQDMYGYWLSDCGIVGFIAQFGYVNAVIFMIPIIKIIIKWKHILLWHKLYLIYYIIMLNMAFWGNSHLGYFSFITYLYLVDKHLRTVDPKYHNGGYVQRNVRTPQGLQIMAKS